MHLARIALSKDPKSTTIRAERLCFVCWNVSYVLAIVRTSSPNSSLPVNLTDPNPGFAAIALLHT